MLCNAIDFPAVDFSKQTLLIAYGWGEYFVDAYLQQFSSGYVLNVVLRGSMTGVVGFWEIAFVIDKLEEESKIELLKIDYQSLNQ